MLTCLYVVNRKLYAEKVNMTGSNTIVGTSTYCTTSSSAPFSASHQISFLSRTCYLCLASKTALSGLQQERLSSRPHLPTLPTHQWQNTRTEETRIKQGLSEPHNQSEGILCQTQIKKKQPSKTSARKQSQTARPRCLVDRGTPLLSRAESSSSFRPGISTSRNP